MGAEVKVKICGLRRPEEARVAVESGADLIGVVLAPARRRVGLELAAEILAAAPAGVVRVGVFVDPTVEEVQQSVEDAGVQMAQLCGNETPGFCRLLSVPAVKSFRFGPQGVTPDPDAYPGDLRHLDSPNAAGGSGIEWDWSLAAGLADKYKVLLAGGLDSENVAAVIESVRPWGVDVSSGVETGGAKDLDKIRRFIAAVKA